MMKDATIKRLLAKKFVLGNEESACSSQRRSDTSYRRSGGPVYLQGNDG